MSDLLTDEVEVSEPGARDDRRAAMLRFAAARATETLVGLAALGVATALALTGSPSWTRVLFTLPVLVAVGGRGVSLLVLGRSLRPSGSAPQRLVDDSLLRGVTPILFGVIVVLTATLVTGVVGLSITPGNVVVAAAVLAAILHVAAAVGRPDDDHRRRTLGSLRDTLVRVVLPATVAVAVLVGGVAIGRSVEASPVERYTQLSLVDPTFYATGQLRTKAGGTVTLGWILRSYEMSLPATPDARVTIAGRATKITTRLLPPSTDPTDATDSLRGEVVFVAPTATGLYRVVLTVGSGDAARSVNLVLQVLKATT